jgi:hypothetical protein
MSTRLSLWLTALTGLALVAFASVQTVRTGEGDALVALAFAGSALLVVALVHQRLESLKLTATGVELRLSKSIVDLGAPMAAKLLEDSGLTGLVESYEFVHRALAGDSYKDARIRLQDALVEQAASLARTQKLDPDEVRRIFREGSPHLRVLALGLMEGDLSTADTSVVLSAISTSRTANEQYHGLVLAERLWRNLSTGDRAAVLAAADADPRIAGDPDRADIVDRLRAMP